MLAQGQWEAEIASRGVHAPHASRAVDIMLSVEDGWATLCIRDGGAGFDWPYYVHRDITDAESHGRGLRLAQQCGFISLIFNAHGNEVTCRGVSSLSLAETGVLDTTVANILQVV